VPFALNMKDIKGFEGMYAVTEDGRVWSYKSEKWMKPMVGTHGYLIVELSNGSRKKGVRYPKQVHRLVAETFIKNKFKLSDVNHIDSNRANPRVENLEWVTRKGNLAHAMRAGRIKVGEQRKNTKLTAQKVKEIRSKYSFWKYTMPMLASEYGVTFNCIQAVLERRNWKHI
jgi:hypothetical protein